MFRIQLFGAGQAHYHKRKLAGFPYHQSGLLLCYLLLNRQTTHTRDRLAAVFWSEQPTDKARKYFRNTLWRLRQTMQATGALAEHFLEVQEEALAWTNSSQTWLDVDQFEQTVDRLGDLRVDALTADQAAQLEAACALYQGDLLESLYEDWCLYDRERLRLDFHRLLTQLMDYYALQNRYADSLKFGNRILQLDNTRESVHRNLMWLYWQNGERSAALAQYKQCVQILKQEFGLQPVELTQQLYLQMLSGQVDPQPWPLRRRTEEPLERGSRTTLRLPESPDTGAIPISQIYARISQLHTVIDSANHELRQIEHLLGQVFPETR